MQVPRTISAPLSANANSIGEAEIRSGLDPDWIRSIYRYGDGPKIAKAIRPKKRIYYKVKKMGELERFFNGGWSIFEILEMTFGDDGYDPEGIGSFASVTSQFYPQIGELYRRRIEVWTAERRRQCGIEDADEPEPVAE